MDKCPKCGCVACGSSWAMIHTTGRIALLHESELCLRHQLAAAQKAVDFERKMVANESAKLSATRDRLKEAARLATESAQLADVLTRDLAAAKERAGRLEAQMVELRDAWHDAKWMGYELMQDTERTFNRILGGS